MQQIGRHSEPGSYFQRIRSEVQVLESPWQKTILTTLFQLEDWQSQ